MNESVVYNMDCMEYMRALPDKAFDLAIVDPPYGDAVERERERVSSASTEVKPTRMTDGRGTNRHTLNNFTVPGAKRRKPTQKEELPGF